MHPSSLAVVQYAAELHAADASMPHSWIPDPTAPEQHEQQTGLKL